MLDAKLLRGLVECFTAGGIALLAGALEQRFGLDRVARHALCALEVKVAKDVLSHRVATSG